RTWYAEGCCAWLFSLDPGCRSARRRGAQPKQHVVAFDTLLNHVQLFRIRAGQVGDLREVQLQVLEQTRRLQIATRGRVPQQSRIDQEILRPGRDLAGATGLYVAYVARQQRLGPREVLPRREPVGQHLRIAHCRTARAACDRLCACVRWWQRAAQTDAERQHRGEADAPCEPATGRQAATAEARRAGAL